MSLLKVKKDESRNDIEQMTTIMILFFREFNTIIEGFVEEDA